MIQERCQEGRGETGISMSPIDRCRHIKATADFALGRAMAELSDGVYQFEGVVSGQSGGGRDGFGCRSRRRWKGDDAEV